MDKTRFFLLPLNLWGSDVYELGFRQNLVMIEIPQFFYCGSDSNIVLHNYREEVLAQLLKQLEDDKSELHDVIAKIRKFKSPKALFGDLDDSWSDEEIVQTMVNGKDGNHSILSENWCIRKLTYDVGKNIVLIQIYSN